MSDGNWMGAGFGSVACWGCAAPARIEFRLKGGGFLPNLEYRQPETLYRIACDECGWAVPIKVEPVEADERAFAVAASTSAEAGADDPASNSEPGGPR